MGERVSYICDVVPVNKLKGNLVKVFIREFDRETQMGKTNYVTVPIDHLVASKELSRSHEDSSKLLFGDVYEELVQDPFFAQFGITFEGVPYSNKKSVIHAKFPDHEKKYIELLKKSKISRGLFRTDLASYSDRLRTELPLFSQVETENGKLVLPPKYNVPVALDDVVNDVYVSLDIETENWDTDKPDIISMIVLTPNKEELPSVIVSRYGKDLHMKKFDGYTFWYTSTHKEMQDALHGYLKFTDPLGLIEYNGSKFDEKKLKELLPKYTPGKDLTQSRVIASPTGKRAVDISGIHVIDLYNLLFQRTYFLRRARLDNYLEYYKLGFAQKSLNYFQLKQAFIEAKAADKEENGDYDSLEEALYYTVQDGEKTKKLGNVLIKEVMRDSIGMQTRPRSVCLSLRSAVSKHWNTKYFKKNNTYRKRFDHAFKPQLKPAVFESFFIPFSQTSAATERNLAFRQNNGIIHEHENIDMSKPVKPQGRLFNTKDGIYTNVKALHPLILQKAFDPIIRGDFYLASVKEVFDKSNDPHRKYVSSWKIKETLSAPLEDYLSFLKDLGINFDQRLDGLPEYFDTKYGEVLTSSRDFGFGRGYGINFQTTERGFSESNNLIELNKRIFAEKDLMEKQLKNGELINYNRDFYFVESIESPLGFLMIGEGNLLSLNKAAIFYDTTRDQIFYFNTKPFNARKSSFEQKLFEKVLVNVLKNYESVNRVEGIEELIYSEFKKVSNGKIVKSDLLIKDKGKYYGFGKGSILPVPESQFLESSIIDVNAYKHHFRKSYSTFLDYLLAYNSLNGQTNLDLTFTV